MSNTVIRWNPFRELAAMQSAMDRIFDDTWRDARPALMGSNLPLDVHESEGEYTIVANLPGVNADDININLHDGTLSIGVEIPQPTAEENVRVLIQERFYGKLSRRINLPQPVDADNVEATYNDGVLTLTLPKTEEAKPRAIPVRTTHMIQGNN